MSRVPTWVDRRFDNDLPVDLHPNVRARLAGAPARVEDLTSGLSTEVLTQRVDGKWSIQENAGHLYDLEELFDRRIHEFITGVETMSPADVTNPGTEKARHNERPLTEVLTGLRAAREDVVAKLDKLPDDAFALVAVHPRLQKPMRLVDMLRFIAEHDDHHIARMRELRALLTR